MRAHLTKTAKDVEATLGEGTLDEENLGEGRTCEGS